MNTGLTRSTYCCPCSSTPLITGSVPLDMPCPTPYPVVSFSSSFSSSSPSSSCSCSHKSPSSSSCTSPSSSSSSTSSPSSSASSLRVFHFTPGSPCSSASLHSSPSSTFLPSSSFLSTTFSLPYCSSPFRHNSTAIRSGKLAALEASSTVTYCYHRIVTSLTDKLTTCWLRHGVTSRADIACHGFRPLALATSIPSSLTLSLTTWTFLLRMFFIAIITVTEINGSVDAVSTDPATIPATESPRTTGTISMLSRSQTYVQAPGSRVTLPCEFHMERFHAFDNPIIWVKSQWTEARTKINTMSIILEPFWTSAGGRRFEVQLEKQNSPRYNLLLKIKDLILADSGGYTCELRDKRAAVLLQVTHIIHVLVSMSQFEPHSSSTPTTLSLTEGVETSLWCIVRGGSPPPNVDVFLGRHNISNLLQISRDYTVSGTLGFAVADVTTTRMTSSFVAHAHNSGQTLKCAASVHESVDHVTAVIRLVVTRPPDIFYAPVIKCPPQSASINEPEVCINCEVTSHPRLVSVFWAVTESNSSDPSSFLYVESGGTSGYEIRVRDQDGESLETTMCVKIATVDTFKTYVVVAENSVDRSTQRVDLTLGLKSGLRSL